jgi:endothelin-converting enzyme/putative endopeptidase
MTVADVDQGGISMPDRDYYLKDDEKTKAVRQAYVTYLKKSFALAGLSDAQASESAQKVLDIETDLARISMDRTARRDPTVHDHKMGINEAAALAPNLELIKFFKYTGVPSFTSLNVENPEFFKQVNGVFTKYPVDAWKTYLNWQMLNFAAPWLSDSFVEARFVYRQALTGQKEQQVRWKRCVDQTDNALGEALGQSFVDQTFGVEGKQRMLKMVNALEQSLHQDISTLPWMTDATKKEAEIKLAAIRNKIGYPDKWRDYSSIKITRDDFLGDFVRASQFEAHRQANKIGKPVDKTEWGMTPPTVNAYYNGQFNEIVFPAGILQPPFFDRNLDDALNFGAIGAVIGHELTHGFDDQGRKFDPQGNLRDWWTPTDAREFEKRAACVADEYSGFTAIDNLKLNGKLTLGENTADNGGARIALMALLSSLQQQAKSTTAAEDPLTRQIDGFTPEQRFFLGFATVWCENRSAELSRYLVTVDPHSPGHWRTNGVLQNMPEFQKAFSCKAGQPMVSANACRVW